MHIYIVGYIYVKPTSCHIIYMYHDIKLVLQIYITNFMCTFANMRCIGSCFFSNIIMGYFYVYNFPVYPVQIDE